jgi:hypothetical protein
LKLRPVRRLQTVLAGEGGAHERRGLVRRESQENLFDKIVEEWRRHGRLRWRLRVSRLGEKIKIEADGACLVYCVRVRSI